MPRLGLLTTKHQAVRAGYGVAVDATGSEIPVDLRMRLPFAQNSACQIPFLSFVSAMLRIVYGCWVYVTHRVAGRVTHYYHTWLTQHKTKNAL